MIRGCKGMATKRKGGRPKGSKSGYTVSEKALAQRRENAENTLKLKPYDTPEGMDYNARSIEHILRIHEIASHADRNDLVSLKSCFIAYLKLCQEDGFKVSNMSAYAAMGMTMDQFKVLTNRQDPETREFVRFVKMTCAMNREAMVADNKINPVIGIFWQRNYDGLRNDTEQVQALQEQEEEYNSKGQYKEKYKNLIGG